MHYKPQCSVYRHRSCLHTSSIGPGGTQYIQALTENWQGLRSRDLRTPWEGLVTSRYSGTQWGYYRSSLTSLAGSQLSQRGKLFVPPQHKASELRLVASVLFRSFLGCCGMLGRTRACYPPVNWPDRRWNWPKPLMALLRNVCNSRLLRSLIIKAIWF